MASVDGLFAVMEPLSSSSGPSNHEEFAAAIASDAVPSLSLSKCIGDDGDKKRSATQRESDPEKIESIYNATDSMRKVRNLLGDVELTWAS